MDLVFVLILIRNQLCKLLLLSAMAITRLKLNRETCAHNSRLQKWGKVANLHTLNLTCEDVVFMEGTGGLPSSRVHSYLCSHFLLSVTCLDLFSCGGYVVLWKREGASDMDFVNFASQVLLAFCSGGYEVDFVYRIKVKKYSLLIGMNLLL